MEDSSTLSFSDAAMARRVAERRHRMVSHRSANFEEADRWDLAYWQSQSPEVRLSALMAIREDVLKAERAREDD